MNAIGWYRSTEAPPPIQRSFFRATRDGLRSWLPGPPDVRGRVMVLPSRRVFPTLSRRGVVSPFHGLFSEFHSVLGALSYAETNGAIGVRVDFDSPLYLDAGQGSNWWTAFFERDTMYIDGSTGTREHSAGAEVRLDSRVRRIGRYGGFSDVVQGETPYLYPMTFGLSRAELHRLVVQYVRLRPEILEASRLLIAGCVDTNAYTVGVHYRGTDATWGWSGRLTHYRTAPVPYTAYAGEVRRVIDAAGPRRVQLFVATDEIDFLAFMRAEFGDAVVTSEDSPRVRAGSNAIHLDSSLGVSNYLKGRSVLVDCLTLAATDYLVKGRSNVSDAALIFNPALPYSFLPDMQVEALGHPAAGAERRRSAPTDPQPAA
jgi:hypothetical protein